MYENSRVFRFWKTRDIFVGGDEQATPRHEVPLPHDNCMSKQFVNDVVSIAILATCWHEVPMPPLEGEVPNEREAEVGECRAYCGEGRFHVYAVL